MIRILIFYPSRIPDPGVKKAPDPGPGSATLNERQRYCGHLRKKENDYYNIRLSVVLRIRGILVRIRIRGSVSLTNGSGSSSFRQWPSRRQVANPQKKFSKFFSKFFLLFLLDDRRSIPLIKGSWHGRPKNLGSRAGTLPWRKQRESLNTYNTMYIGTKTVFSFKFSAVAQLKIFFTNL